MADPQGLGLGLETFAAQMGALKDELEAARKAAGKVGQELALGPAPVDVPKFASVEEAEQWLALERARQRVHAELEATADERFIASLTQATLGPPPVATIDWNAVLAGKQTLPPGTTIDFTP